MCKLAKYSCCILMVGFIYSAVALFWWGPLPVRAASPNAVKTAEGKEILSRPIVYERKLVNVQLVASYNAKQIVSVIKKYYTLPGQNISKLVSTATAVDAYAITYRTRDAAGRATIASGLVALPSPLNGVYPVIQYHHGTQFNNKDVPSDPRRSPEALCSMALFAAHGYILSLPDYLGQGKGRPPHPYLHARSMATASADMLKAVSELCNRFKVNTNSNLFICGLSEGGHATLALQRRIEADPGAQPFQLTASAPMAGAYDVRKVWSFLANANPPGTVPLLIHIYLSYRKTYGLTDRLTDVFIAPYNKKAPSIDDGTHDGHEMYKLLPKTIQKVMRKTFLDAVASGEHPLDEKMEGNSTFNFLPITPTRLYHGRDDELAPFSMSEMVCAHMKQLGATDVEVVNIGGGVGHEESFFPSTLMAKKWFDTF